MPFLGGNRIFSIKSKEKKKQNKTKIQTLQNNPPPQKKKN